MIGFERGGDQLQYFVLQSPGVYRKASPFRELFRTLATNVFGRLVGFCYAKASLHAIQKMTSTKSSVKQKVAVVGSGMAGLVTAHLLHNDMQQRYSVTVFESVRMYILDSSGRWSDKLH